MYTFAQKKAYKSKHCNMEQFLYRHRTIILVGMLIVFGVLFGLISIGNHLLFKTYGLDLGVYTHASYNYAHLRANDCTFFLWEPQPLLSDHFDLYLILFAPLTYIFGQYTLLIIQIISILFGALGVYKLTQLHTQSTLLTLIAPLLVLFSFGIWSAIGSDYHSNVPSAMLLPWLLYFIKREKLGLASLMVFAIIIAKETQSLWVIFVLLGLLWDYRKDTKIRRWLLWNMLGTVVYAFVVIILIMPSLHEGASPGFWRYSWMGENFKEMAIWLITHPLQALQNLFVDFMPNADRSILKREFYICALCSGLFFALLKPNYLLMIIPPLFLKMYAQAPEAFWGINCHYNIEICMVLCIASVVVLAKIPTMEENFKIQKIQSLKLRVFVPVLALILTAGTLFYTIDKPYTQIRRDHVNLFDKRHWHQNDFDPQVARRMLKQIPPDVSVCAATMFTPHLATREECHIFPISLGHHPEYFLFPLEHWTYYEKEKEMVAEYIADTTHYECLDNDGFLFLLKRR